MLVPRALERGLDLRALGHLTGRLSPKTCATTKARMSVVRPARSTPRRVDGEVERAPPALAAKLDLDQAVDGVDLVRGVVVDRAQPLERDAASSSRPRSSASSASSSTASASSGWASATADAASKASSARPARPWMVAIAPQRVDVSRLTLERLAESWRPRPCSRPEREVAEVDERRRVVRIGLEHALERLARALEVAFFETGRASSSVIASSERPRCRTRARSRPSASARSRGRRA